MRIALAVASWTLFAAFAHAQPDRPDGAVVPASAQIPEPAPLPLPSPTPADPPIVIVDPPPPGPPAPPAKPAEDDDDAGAPAVRDSNEYLLWWMRSTPLPPLAARNREGVPFLTDAGTRLLVGGRSMKLGEQSGGRFIGGFPICESHAYGVEYSYFFLGSRTTTFMATGTDAAGGANVGVPYIDAATGLPANRAIATPGQLAGEFRAADSARTQGFEVNIVGNLLDSKRCQIDAIFGYRFLMINEGLNIWQQGRYSRTVDGVGPGLFSSNDQIDAHNRFHGGQIGLRGDIRKGPIFLEAIGKIAFGATTEVVNIGGMTSYSDATASFAIVPGGFFAQSTNSGRTVRDAFAVVPEVGLRVGFGSKDRCRTFVGYNFLALSDAVRPGDQIDRTINVSHAPRFGPPGALVGPERPWLAVRSTDVWIQGITIGMESRW